MKFTRQQITNDLHRIFTAGFETFDFEVTMQLMQVILDKHGLKFKAPMHINEEFFISDTSDMLASFGEEINTTKCNKLPHFAYICEGFIDFDGDCQGSGRLSLEEQDFDMMRDRELQEDMRNGDTC